MWILLANFLIFLNENKIVILSLFAIIIAIIGIYLRISRKSLSYYIDSANLVVSIEERITDRVKILFDEVPVEDVRLIIFDIMNSGNLPILIDDYDTPLEINLGEEAMILSASIVQTEPLNLKPVFTISPIKKCISIDPLLLNAGDLIKFNILVSKCEPSNIRIEGRVVGVKEIKQEAERSINQLFFIFLAFLTYIVSFFMLFSDRIDLIYVIFGLLFSLVLMIIGVISDKRMRRRLLERIRR